MGSCLCFENFHTGLTDNNIDQQYSKYLSCSIKKVEYRGITINQLLFLYDEIKIRCVKENWKDYKGNLLTPEKVNLYDIKETIIKFRTAKYQCSYVELC